MGVPSRLLGIVCATVLLGATAGCSLLMDFGLCENREDCHKYEEQSALICRGGNCVQAKCHADRDCPGNEEYHCRDQVCVHRDQHGDEGRGTSDAAADTADGAADTGGDGGGGEDGTVDSRTVDTTDGGGDRG